MEDPVVDRPMLVVLREKHGDGYYLVRDLDELHRTALGILRGRHEQDIWYFEPREPKKPEVGDPEELPKALRGVAREKLRFYEQEQARYEEEKDWFNRMSRALVLLDGRAAWELLQERADHEYEGIDLERFEDPGSYGH